MPRNSWVAPVSARIQRLPCFTSTFLAFGPSVTLIAFAVGGSAANVDASELGDRVASADSFLTEVSFISDVASLLEEAGTPAR